MQTSPLISWKPPTGLDLSPISGYYANTSSHQPTPFALSIRHSFYNEFVKLRFFVSGRISRIDPPRNDGTISGGESRYRWNERYIKFQLSEFTRASCSRRRIYPKYRLKTDKIDRVRRRWEARDWKNRSNQAYPRLITLNYSNNIFPSDWEINASTRPMHNSWHSIGQIED